MGKEKSFSNLENASAILNGMSDCSSEFVDLFKKVHTNEIDNNYMYDWLLRSLIDVIKINHSVLYVACGTAGYTRLFKNIKRFVGLDFSNKMILAAKQFNCNTHINTEFHCTTFEKFTSDELFDVIYLGPYGHYVPYSYFVLEKSKLFLKSDGMLFCTIMEPQSMTFFAKCKETIKQLFLNKDIEYDPVKKIEKMLKKTGWEIYVKIRINNNIGYGHCYIAKQNK